MIAKICSLIENFIVFCYSKEYQLKLESYRYCDKHKSYLLIFRVRNKKVFRIIAVERVCCDKEWLNMIHPVDAYIAGIIYAIYKNGIIVKWNLMDYFKDYNSYVIIEPFLSVEIHYMDHDNLTLLKDKNGKELFTVSILDFGKNPFLFHAVGSVISNQLGFIVSEKFIAEIN